MTAPAGYRFRDPGLAPSPVTVAELEQLKATVLWSDADTEALRRAGEILAPQVEQILDLWYGFVGSHPHLVETFAGPDGAPDAAYLGAVRARFARWILDTCAAEHDQAWLDWQHEISLRHHVSGKNRTDGVASASAQVPMRYLVAFVVPLTVTIRAFLAAGASDDADLDAMYAAWFKAVALTSALWTRPYAPGW